MTIGAIMAVVSVGTKVVTGPSGVSVIPPNVDYELKDNEKEIRGIRGIEISIQPAELITATIEVELNLRFPIPVYPGWSILTYDPNSKDERKVKQVKFEDGSTLIMKD